MDEEWLIIYQKMDEIVSLILTLFPTPLSGFPPFFWWPPIFIFFRWLLYSDIVISNMFVQFHYRIFIAHIIFNVEVFVICMLPLLYLPNYLFFFLLRFFCEIIVTLPSIQLPYLITLSSLSSCDGKQYGVQRQAVDLLAWMEESGWRNPNNPHIKVMLQYYRKHPSRNKYKYDHTEKKLDWCRLRYIYCNLELQFYKWSLHSR